MCTFKSKNYTTEKLIPNSSKLSSTNGSSKPRVTSGHTVPGPGPGTQNQNSLSFAAALRTLAQQSVPPTNSEHSSTGQGSSDSTRRDPGLSAAEKAKVNPEVSIYGVSNAVPVRTSDSRLPLTNPADRYSAPTVSDLGRSGFQPYRPEERVSVVPPVGLDVGLYPSYGYPSIPMLDEQLYYDRARLLRPPWPPFGHPMVNPYMIPGAGAIPFYMPDSLKLEEEHRRIAAIKKDEQMERELLQHQREREQREKDRALREREKAQSRISPHIPPPHLTAQSPMMVPLLHPGSMLPPTPMSLSSSRNSIPMNTPFLPPVSLPQTYSVPRSSPSLQRHSPHTVTHPPSSSYLPQRQSPVIQPSGPLINNTVGPSSQVPRSSPKPPTPKSISIPPQTPTRMGGASTPGSRSNTPLGGTSMPTLGGNSTPHRSSSTPTRTSSTPILQEEKLPQEPSGISISQVPPCSSAARKPTIAPTMVSYEQSQIPTVNSTFLPKTNASTTNQNIDQSRQPIASKSNIKALNYNIESIVCENSKNKIETKIEQKKPKYIIGVMQKTQCSETDIHLSNANSESKSTKNKLPCSKTVSLNLGYENKIDRNKNIENSSNSKVGQEEITLVNLLGLDKEFNKQDALPSWEEVNGIPKCKSTIFGNSNLPDLSAQVKHGSTPVNNPSQQTFSPQLPAPSPNYPVQSQVTQIIIETTKESQKPNLTSVVPIINNNYINAVPITSHTRTNDSTLSTEIERVDCNIKVEDASSLSNGVIVKMENIIDNIEENRCNDPLSMDNKVINDLVCKPGVNNFKLKSRFTVLNIPSVPGPPFKRRKLSKIDLAVVRRKLRRVKKVQKPKRMNRITNSDDNICTKQFGVNIYGNSDSSSSSSSDSDSDCDVFKYDTWIKSGPPLKPSYTPKKLCFLNIFGLTTHITKNSIEVQKMERRKWHQMQTLTELRDGEEELEKKVYPLNLPVPLKSPSVLNYMTDFKKKSNFLQVLGLSTVPARIRDGKFQASAFFPNV
ncbi:hypothetical protein HHI36_001423 [Cryptolaemus montrouzieri]|uniref:Genetic suppressor element-like domain-containing protein n=1 Tax=Cryptolaemus montrouzieri TaxID=559131 RepID=A0ABD2P7K3_9CUCU